MFIQQKGLTQPTSLAAGRFRLLSLLPKSLWKKIDVCIWLKANLHRLASLYYRLKKAGAEIIVGGSWGKDNKKRGRTGPSPGCPSS
jgi:hypothetical protein